MINKINHTTEALKSLISIYTDATAISKFIKSFQIINDDIENYLIEILVNIDIGKAKGENLDIIGQLVGIPRPQLGAYLNPVFVYANLPNTVTENDGGYGTGRYTDTKDKDTKKYIPMSDEDYSRILQAKIHLNYYGGTIDNILKAISLLCTDNPIVKYDISKPMEPEFTIYKALTPVERIIFQGSVATAIESATFRINTIFDTFIYPKTMGVWYSIKGINSIEFAYKDQPVTGRNSEGVKFTETGGFSDGKVNNITAGVYWSGKK